MVTFNIEGKNYDEAVQAVEDGLDVLQKEFAAGEMKAGRYLGLYYIMKAAERGDITSQVTLGSLYEFGNIVDRNPEEAKRWYEKALARDHPRKDGTMLAAGASAGIERLKLIR